MALSSRQRTHPPTMWTDEVLIELPGLVRLTGLGLRHYVDDEGRGSARAQLIRSDLYPLDESMTTDVIDEHMQQLEAAGYLTQYVVDGRWCLQLTEWPKVDRGTPSRIPAPPTAREEFASGSRTPRESLAVEEERKEGGGRQVGGQGQEVGGSRSAATSEPSPFCSKHQPWGTDEKCGPCGGARKRHELWIKDQAEQEPGIEEATP